MSTQQTLEPEIFDEAKQYSIFHGPADPPLVTLSLGDFLDLQCSKYGPNECIITPWNGTRWTYHDLQDHSTRVARYLHAIGIQPGDRVSILASNRAEYASIFFACVGLGAILVILNNTYTKAEAEYALQYTESKLLFATPWIGRQDNRPMLEQFKQKSNSLPHLQQIISLDPFKGFTDYQEVIAHGAWLLKHAKQAHFRVSPYTTCNLQFTSGSTGHPKAAMLTHMGLLNNSRFIGHRMNFTHEDVLCCPPPMFHCFGLVLGLLTCIAYGAKIVYPSETFDGPSVLEAITAEKCTALHGVPAMFDTLFSLPRPQEFDCSRLRTGIIAGAPVPRYLMELLVNEFGMTEFTSSYGLTEASPTCFNAYVNDTIERRLSTVGTLMPHAHGKIINRKGEIVPIGERGELCIAGYQVQQGYWNNPHKTAETMSRDEDGVLWLHTGDEAVFDKYGYCTITGRFKDIIIRGGENIYPLEIEERLTHHEAIKLAIVVGLPHSKYQEIPAAFLQRVEGARRRPSDNEIRDWVRVKLGHHKAPAHIFWLGEDGVAPEIPMTGSGKVKKFELRKLGRLLLERAGHEQPLKPHL